VAGKKMVGAMAGGVVNADIRGYAYESGFFVLELTGDTVQLIPPPDGFMPKKWQRRPGKSVSGFARRSVGIGSRGLCYQVL
jgi:hypothetical protein